ncbi:MAG: GTPase ObgE [Candidatus Schekmanbacteria bacterium]|nr:MAG: GTPase ObgE [Candidatus Schekmanbacteria bacterium]
MFIDEATVYVKAGDGGNGCVSFRREKFVPFGGPDGGDGGKGGDVIFRASSRKSTLIDFKYKPHIKAARGVHGKGSGLHGKNGEDKIVLVPVGTLIYDKEDSSLIADLDCEGAECVVAKGGRGGRGNARFKSSTNQAPRTFEEGEKGEERTLRLELKLMADVGLVGFPNAGKSTLISVVSNAHPKVGDYPFTTLEPSLGVIKVDEENSFVIADIPGLIEGAHKGSGLGLRFLKHIERTGVILYLIDYLGFKEKSPIEIFATLKAELYQYNPELLNKKQIIALNKIDLESDESKIKKVEDEIRQKSDLEVYSISAIRKKGLKKLIWRLNELILKSREEKNEN